MSILRSFWIVLLASIVIDAEAVSLAVFNDLHERVDVLEALAGRVGRSVDLAVLNGDMLEDVREQDSVRKLLIAPMRRLEKRLGAPVVFARGNHETRGAGARRLWRDLGLAEERYYSARTVGDVRLVFLDTCENADDALQRSRNRPECDAYLVRERAWLERELASDAWRDAKARIVVAHIPPAVQGADVQKGGVRFAPRREAKALCALLETLNGRGVSLLVGGHYHWRLFQPATPARDYPVVTGGGPDPANGEAVRRPVVTRVDVEDDFIRVRAVSTDGRELFRRDLPLHANPRYSLNGEWTLDYWPEPDDAPVRTLPVTVPHGTVKATVPGNCELDLVRAGAIPPAEIGMNCFTMRNLEDHQWLYTKRFVAPQPAPGERFRLVFDSIDTLADVFVNGRKVGESDNMLIPRAFDVTGVLRPGETNTVQVLIRSVMLAARDEIVGQLGHFTGGGADAEPFRKAFHMGGWDILPRLFAAGLSRDVYLEVVRPMRIDCVNWMVKSLSKDNRRASLNVYSRIRAPWALVEKAKVRYTLARNGRIAFEDVRPFHCAQNYITFDLKDPVLWWPRGAGEAALYEAAIELLSPEGRVLAADSRRIGIRTVRLERDDCYSKERPGQFRFVVNGVPVFMRGTNWVPIDSFHGRDDLLLDPLLEMLADLNCNMVRVWGGGVYELDRFYDWCDAHGVMVWQDFMMGCAIFPQNPKFLDRFREEVLATVLRLRDHPSLALWSGNNENDLFYAVRVGGELAPDPNRDKPSREVIPGVLMEFDVSRPYLPSSPYCSPDVIARRAKPSEDHLWGGSTYWKSGFYTNSQARFVSETGYHGCPKVETLRQMFSPGCVYPWTNRADKTSFNREWRFKATAPLMDEKFQPFLWRRPQTYCETVERMFGSVPDDLETFVEASEIVQAEALKYWVEMHRANKFGRSNGLLWWNLRDGWPVLSDAVVDYYNRRKLAYFAIRAVQRDVLATVRDLDRHAVIVNDRMRAISGRVTMRDAESARVLLDRAFEVPANGTLDLGPVDFGGLPARGAVLIDGRADGVDLRNHYLYGEQPFDLAKVRGWLKDRPLYDKE